MKIVNLYPFFIALFVLMSIPSQSVAIPSTLIADDVSEDVKLDDDNYGSYTIGDNVPSAGEIDIKDVSYTYVDSKGEITLKMELFNTLSIEYLHNLFS